MRIEDLDRVAVIGGGQMGRQIALNTAIYGYNVTVYTIDERETEAVNAWVARYLEGRVAKGRLDQAQTEAIAARFHATASMEEAVAGAQLMIEAVLEQKEIKENVFRALERLAAPGAVVASNSSYMCSSLFADCFADPSRLANLHYFNPALVMKLVEVVQGAHTSDETIALLMAFAERTGKQPVHLRKETDGFVVNSIMRAMRDQAYYLLENGICDPQGIDTAVRLGLNYPMGPFELNDLTGIDSTYYQNERRLSETGVKPNGYDIVKQKYEAREWGKKTGRGFYTYDK